MAASDNISSRQFGPSYSPPMYKPHEYTEGYEHGRTGGAFKGYGGRQAAISYGSGYRHGRADRAGTYAGGNRTAQLKMARQALQAHQRKLPTSADKNSVRRSIDATKRRIKELGG